jgi:hypothetical protein
LFQSTLICSQSEALNLGIKTFFRNFETWLLRWFHGKKDLKKCD